jgi:hypothetical protein
MQGGSIYCVSAQHKKLKNILMKKSILYIGLILGIVSCENMDTNFPDYDLQAVYFPIQLPLRTLSLGEDRMDNSVDRELKFDIGISIGGMYTNNKEWTVDYVIDTTLCMDTAAVPGYVVNQAGRPLKPLPSSYYTLSPTGTATIKKGDFSGLIRVELTQAFLDDSLAMTGEYVIPLQLTGTSADSILSGKAAEGIANPDKRIVAHWLANQTPKDWVLFGIKYVNAYHGSYIHRGMNIRSVGGVPQDTVKYMTKYLVDNRIMKLTTVGKQTVQSDAIGNQKTGAQKYSMQLNFTNTSGETGSFTISPVTGAVYSVTGTGNFFDLSDTDETFSNLKFQSMHMQYTYVSGGNTHQCFDTLMFRDRGIVYQELRVPLFKP